MFAVSLPMYGPQTPLIDVIDAKPYIVTAYTVGDRFTPSHGITASGERVRTGVTLSCPRELPLGTVVSIEGVGRRTCTDRGGRITGHHLDLYVPTVKQALKFGKQTLDVTIIPKEDD